jgi:hypothetical protein
MFGLTASVFRAVGRSHRFGAGDNTATARMRDRRGSSLRQKWHRENDGKTVSAFLILVKLGYSVPEKSGIGGWGVVLLFKSGERKIGPQSRNSGRFFHVAIAGDRENPPALYGAKVPPRKGFNFLLGGIESGPVLKRRCEKRCYEKRCYEKRCYEKRCYEKRCYAR